MVLVYTFKALYVLEVANIKDHLLSYEPAWPLWSPLGALLLVSPIFEARRGFLSHGIKIMEFFSQRDSFVPLYHSLLLTGEDFSVLFGNPSLTLLSGYIVH